MILITVDIIAILGVFPLDYIAYVVAPRCEGTKLIIRVINFELVQPIRPRYVNVTDGQTDRRTDLLQQYRALHYMHRSVKMRSACSRKCNRADDGYRAVWLRRLASVGVLWLRGSRPSGRTRPDTHLHTTVQCTVHTRRVVSHRRSESRIGYLLLRATAYMLSAHMLSQFRLSVCLSVTRMDQSKTVEVRIMQFSPYSSHIPLVFAR